MRCEERSSHFQDKSWIFGKYNLNSHLVSISKTRLDGFYRYALKALIRGTGDDRPPRFSLYRPTESSKPKVARFRRSGRIVDHWEVIQAEEFKPENLPLITNCEPHRSRMRIGYC